MEYGTDPGKRVYCYKCERFISEKHAGKKWVTCGKCEEKTCQKCKRKSHGSDPCPTDIELEKTLRLIKNEGWKKCPKCGRVIEREEYTCSKMT
jgi:hypothetical protein